MTETGQAHTLDATAVGAVSHKDIEDALFDITAGVFPQKSESEVRAGIYVSEIELFDQPESSEQIEPDADNPRKGAHE